MTWTPGAATAAPRGAAPDEALRTRPMAADAQLADVAAVDAEHAWAVGDRGVIWHTVDGGRTWRLQTTDVDCRLSSVVFLDRQVGWAAGGYTQPYTHTTHGVVLRTRDGGEHWTAERKLNLPTVARVGFFDPLHGWALGATSGLFPSGVFSTEDGGRSWSALPAGTGDGWLAGDFVDPNTGALAGRTSVTAVVRRRSVEPAAADFGLRALARMRLVAPAKGWLVGEGGLVLHTRDLGKTWQTTAGALPPGAAEHFDFAALAVRGPHCWVAGTPGTRVFHSADGGASWAAGDTGQPLPVHGLAFADERCGWAVGDLGTILKTTDGGRTWQKQRAGGARAAFVGIYGRPEEVPWELVARLSSDEGYLGALEVIGRTDLESSAGGCGADAPQRAHEASIRAGASAAESAWRFPLRQSGLVLSGEQLVEGWNRVDDVPALERLEAHVVARIRTWRPSVVFTSSTDSSGNDPLAHVVNQVVLRAVEAAGEATRHPRQIDQAGLAPWKVQKVFALLPGGAGGAVSMDTAQLSARYGRTIGELAGPARGVLESRINAPAGALGFRLLVDHIPQEVGRRDFFSGIALAPGGEARRLFEAVADSDLQSLHREAQRRRNLQAILARADTDGRDEGRFLADIGQQTKAMQADRAAELLLQLAQRYSTTGRWEMAAECYALVVDRYPQQPAAGVALAWLIQFHASGEVAWRLRRAEGLTVQQVAAVPPPLGAQRMEKQRPGRGVHQAAALHGVGEVQQAGGLARDLRAASSERSTIADNYSKQLEQLQPALMAEPAVRFPLAVAHRQLGLPRQAERYYLGLRHGRPDDAWRECALTELWLIQPKDQPPKKLWTCLQTRDKPRLDGKLDEPLWNANSTVQLRSTLGDDAQWPAAVMLARDDEFLYVAASCTRAEGFAYAASDAPRPRDPDLSAQDRIELLIDMDRDFATYDRLVIDHRGWTSESCWGDKTWNPTWYVAHGESDGAWTVEAAIPLAELTGDVPAAGGAWAVGAQRIVPGVGFQSWTTPAAVEARPEGFGYVLFR
ncbi:MAG: YCF48-related protein [Pirellulales bacterium]